MPIETLSRIDCLSGAATESAQQMGEDHLVDQNDKMGTAKPTLPYLPAAAVFAP
jgi:hypothetical protein